MAILGFQIISTLIGASILSKIITKSTFIARFIYDSLHKHVSPNDDIIMELANLSKVKSKTKKTKSKENSTDEFFFPRDTKIPLLRIKVNEYDLSNLPMYSDLVWLCDFSFCAILVYISNEIFNYFGNINVHQDTNVNSSKSSLIKIFDTSQIKLNLSLVWLSITLIYSLLVLKKILKIFLNKPKVVSESSLSPELIMILSVTFMFFILNFFFLTFDEKFLDFKLNQLHLSLTSNSSSLPDSIKFTFTREKIQIFLSLIGSFLSGLFLFPGMRFGRMFLDTIRSPSQGILVKTCNTFNFIMPFFLLLLWFIPFTNYFLPIFLASSSAIAASSGFLFIIEPINVLITTTKAENMSNLRVFVTLLYIILRFSMVKVNLQAYLNIAKDTAEKILKEPGKISNIEFRNSLNNIFCCFNLVASQYISPLIISFCFLSLYKNTAGLSWLPWSPMEKDLSNDLSTVVTGDTIELLPTSDNLSYLESVIFTRNQFYLLLESMKTQGYLIGNCIFGFILWSSIINWFIISIVGVFYYQYSD